MRQRNRTVVSVALVAILVAAVGAWAAKPAKKDKVSEPQTPGVDIAATIGERQITVDEVDAKLLSTNMNLAQELYTARRSTVDEMISDSLLDTEAKSRGLTREKLVEQEIAQQVKPVTEDDIAAFYEQNKANMRGQTIEQMREQLRPFLTQQNESEARNTYLATLREKANVKVRLGPPRAKVSVAADEPSRGPINAPVQIVTYSEFQCPYCSRVGPTMAKLVETFGEKVRIVFRDFPLAMHPNARPAAIAAQCAHEQGKFWEYHEKLFANQRALAAENLKTYATEVGLDGAKFDECVTSQRFGPSVDSDMAEGQRLGVTGTPAFFVNGRFMSGAQPFEAFQKMINEELELGQGTSAAPSGKS